MISETTNQVVRSNEQNFSDLHLNQEVIFSNHKSVYKKSVEKRQTNLIKKIPYIKPFLNKDEEIFLITTGCSPVPFLRQLLTGPTYEYLNRSLFIFSNNRIFHIPTKINYSYRNTIAQILYTDCKSIKLKGNKLIVNYKNGERETFLHIARNEKKKIKTLLEAIVAQNAGKLSFDEGYSNTKARTHLCPRCRKELEEGKYVCPNCNLEFKEKSANKKISLIYPGGGFFYTRHLLLGIGDAITELVLIYFYIIFLVGLIISFMGMTSVILLLALTIAFAIAIAWEKSWTIYHTNHFIKEFIPKEKVVKVIV